MKKPKKKNNNNKSLAKKYTRKRSFSTKLILTEHLCSNTMIYCWTLSDKINTVPQTDFECERIGMNTHTEAQWLVFVLAAYFYF